MKPTFEEWMRAVDAQVEALCGCSVRDLPDCMFHDWWADGVSAKAAARRAVRNARDEEE